MNNLTEVYPIKPVKRVLILYLSIGSGHFSAANSIKKAIQQIDSTCEVFCEDLFTPIIRNSILPEFLSLNASVFFSKIYDTAWHTGSMLQAYEMIKDTSVLRERVQEFVEFHNPDLIVCTHSLPASILAKMRLDDILSIKVLAVSTDFLVHPYWPAEGVDGFVVASEHGKELLANRGYGIDKTRVFGIPVDPDIETFLGELHEEQGHRKEKLILPLNVLVLAGGKRLAPYVSIWSKTINLIRESKKVPDGLLNWHVICGKPSIFGQLIEEGITKREDVTVQNYVQNFSSILSRQQIVITKPGGLILAESAALGIPVILLSRGSGQESANSSIFISKSAGKLAENEHHVINLLRNFIENPMMYYEMVQAATNLGKPASSRLIADWILRDLRL